MLCKLLLFGPTPLELSLAPVVVTKQRLVLKRSLLVELEKFIVFVLKVLSLRQPELGDTEFMF